MFAGLLCQCRISYFDISCASLWFDSPQKTETDESTNERTNEHKKIVRSLAQTHMVCTSSFFSLHYDPISDAAQRTMAEITNIEGQSVATRDIFIVSNNVYEQKATAGIYFRFFGWKLCN